MARYEVALRLATAYRDAFNAWDVAGILLLLHPDCSLDAADSTDGALYTGKEEIKSYLESSFQTAPGVFLIVEEVYSLGWHCVMRWRLKQAMGEEVRGVYLFTVRDDLIYRMDTYIKVE